MKKVIKLILLSLLGIIVFAAAALAAAVAITGKGEITPFYDQIGAPLPGSVAERAYIDVNGRKNGLVLRGKNTENPVLLYISGGPGVPQYWMNEYMENKLDEHFTVCWWDYYGEGLSYSKELKPADITLERLEKDAVTVAEYLKERFGKQKVYLMAHSGGSMLGLRLAQDCPEDFYCYFAMGQMAGDRYTAGYGYLKETFERTGNKKGLALINKHVRLENGVPVLYNEQNKGGDWESALLMAGCATTREMRSDAFGLCFPQLFSKCYTFKEKYEYWRGMQLCQKSAYADTDIALDERPAKIPVYFISGRYDYTCPVNNVELLYNNIEAPDKALHIFEDSAHSPLWEENGAVLEAMLEHVGQDAR